MKSTEPLVLVSAPAGSGKTVTLTQWLRAEDRPGIWLRLDGNDNDPIVFLRCIAVALDQARWVEPEILELLQLRSPQLVDVVLPGLAATVAGARPFVLVLDDAQLVQKQEAWAYLELVLENLPEGAQLVVATRSDPPLPVGRLRGRGELLEVRFEELAFDGDEALQLLRLLIDGRSQTARRTSSCFDTNHWLSVIRMGAALEPQRLEACFSRKAAIFSVS